MNWYPYRCVSNKCTHNVNTHNFSFLQAFLQVEKYTIKTWSALILGKHASDTNYIDRLCMYLFVYVCMYVCMYVTWLGGDRIAENCMLV